MDQAALDPHALIRRFHAAHNILQNPMDPRDWLHLPSDVMHHVLDSLDADAGNTSTSSSSSSNLANLRLTCRVWNGCVNRHMDKMRLGLWPARPAFLGQFTSLSELTLSAGSIADPEERVATVRPLLDTLGGLPKLQRLALTYAGPGSIDNLDKLQGLTHLALSNPCVHSRRPASSTAAAAADAAAAGVDADLAATFGHQQNHHQQQQPLLPGAVGEGEGEDDMQQQQQQGANSNSSSDDGSHSSHSSSGSTGSPKDAAVLPESVGRLGQLQQLLLVDMTPEFSVLSQLTALDRLEVRGQTMRLAGSHVLACNPLPGVGVLRGLTHLVARSNYGINRLPGDLGSLSLLQHLDVSKNMLWALPAELTLLTSLEHLDVSSNCLSTIPDSISLLAGRLTFLDISNNSRVALPGTLGGLHKLVQLNISWIWSDLGVLWEGATGLSSLQVLNVVGNGVSQLPATVGSFKSITHLALSMNNLTSLPDSIGCLTTLQHLEVSDNRLQDLPGTLGRLLGLHSLGLRSNCLFLLPVEVGRLSRLTYLDASMNNIASLPDSLTGLTNLNQLALSMNPLGVLPSGLTALQKLRILEMYYVKLEDRGDQQPTGSCKALQDAIPGLYVFSNTLSADQYGAELAELAAAEAEAADPDSDEGDGHQPQAAAAIAATAAAAAAAVPADPAGFDAADMEGLVEAAAVEQQQVGVGRSANADLEQQQQQQQQQAGPSRAARAAAGLTVDVTHLDPVTLPGGLVIDLNTLEVTRRTEESEGVPPSSAAAGSSSFGGQQQQQAGLCSVVPAAAAAGGCEEGEDLTLLLSPVGMSAGSFCSSGLPSPLQAGALFNSPTGSDSSSGGSSSNGRRLPGGQLLRSSCGSSVASDTPDCDLTTLAQPSAAASLAVAGVCCVAEQHQEQGCSDTATAADTKTAAAAAAAATGAGSNGALLQSFGSNLSVSSISSSNGDQKAVSWYDASIRSRRNSTLSSASCPCLASAAAAAAAAGAAATEPSAAAVAAMSAVAAAGSNAGGGSSSRSAVVGGTHGAGGTNALPLPGSWSFDVSMLAAARLASHSVGEGTDGVAPLPMLPRSRSVGRSLLSRYSRGGEASNSPTGLGFQSIQQQQQQQQQRAAAACVDGAR